MLCPPFFSLKRKEDLMTIDLVAFKNALELLFAKEELSVDSLNKI
jgi:hypothetical protein